MTTPWNNGDGLTVRFGSDEATQGKVGDYEYDGPRNLTELTITLTDATATDGGTIYDYNNMLPKGARIEEIMIVTVTAATGSGAVLNLGLIRTDLTTELDYNGLLAAAAQTVMTPAGKTTVVRTGDTYAGALLGTTLANNGLFTIDYDTAAFTAGKIVVRIFWTIPT